MRYLSLSEILELHERIISSSGGLHGVHDIKRLESSINQPRQTFKKKDLYPNTVSKAAALCFFLVKNHPFIDGNKRIGHAAMETFLILNGYEITANVDEQERIMLDLASGNITLQNFTAWLNNNKAHITTA
jgi:death-on-curing protein